MARCEGDRELGRDRKPLDEEDRQALLLRLREPYERIVAKSE